MQRRAPDNKINRFGAVDTLLTNRVQCHLQLCLLLLRVSLQVWLKRLRDLPFELIRSLRNLALVLELGLHTIEDIMIV